MERTFEQELAREVDAWKPEDEPRLVGVVADLSIEEIASKSGDLLRYPLVTIETEDGRQVEWHATGTVPRKQLAQLQPKVGERIGIRFLGKRQSSSGRDYDDFRVVLDRPSEPKRVDWSLVNENAKSAKPRRADPQAESISWDEGPYADPQEPPDDEPPF